MAKLCINNLSHEYYDNEVFSGLEFEFEGRCLAIMGPNGSGKSTLLKIIAGLMCPTEGNVELQMHDEPLTRDILRNSIGLAAPDVRLYPELTPRENLEFLLQARGIEVEQTHITRTLEALGLGKRANSRFNELSSGLKRKACIAAAIIHRPYLLLLDEPFTNLDADGKFLLRALIEKWKERGMVIIATNDPAETDLAEKYINLGEIE